MGTYKQAENVHPLGFHEYVRLHTPWHSAETQQSDDNIHVAPSTSDDKGVLPILCDNSVIKNTINVPPRTPRSLL